MNQARQYSQKPGAIRERTRMTDIETKWRKDRARLLVRVKVGAVELLLTTLAKENWTITTHNAFGSDRNPYQFRTNAYHFTRPVQTS